jgi:hypothetical protein
MNLLNEVLRTMFMAGVRPGDVLWCGSPPKAGSRRAGREWSGTWAEFVALPAPDAWDQVAALIIAGADWWISIGQGGIAFHRAHGSSVGRLPPQELGDLVSLGTAQPG